MKTNCINKYTHSSILSLHHRFIVSAAHFVKSLLLLSSLSLSLLTDDAAAQSLADYKNGRIVTYAAENKYWFVFQDKQGFIWGYDKDNKVIRFDGSEVRTFKSDISDKRSIQPVGRMPPIFYEDTEGKIWIGMSPSGLDRYDPLTDSFEHYEQKINKPIKASPRLYGCFYEDKNKDVFIGTQVGVFQYIRKDDTFRLASYFGFTAVIFEDKEGVLLAGDPMLKSVIIKLNYTNYSQTEKDSFPKVKLRDIDLTTYYNEANTLTLRMLEHEDKYLIRDVGYVFEYDRLRHKISLLDTTYLKPNERISYIYQDNGVVLFGTTRYRIIQYDPFKRSFSTFLELPHKENYEDPVLKIFRTKDNILWVVTLGKTFKILPFKTRFHKLGLPKDQRPSTKDVGNPDFYVQFKKNIYFNTSNGLRPVLGNTPSVKDIKLDFTAADLSLAAEVVAKFPHLKDPSSMTGFKFAEDIIRKKLWLLVFQYPYGMKLISYDENGKKLSFLRCTGRDSCFVDHHMDFSINHQGRLLMAGWAGVSIFDPNTGLFKNISKKGNPNSRATWSILEDKSHRIWVGTNERGVMQIDLATDSIINYQHDDNNPSSISTDYFLNDIVEDKHGRVWFSSLYGLNIWDGKTNTFQKLFEKDGLPSNLVLSMIEDKNQNIWIATKTHLTQYNFDRKTFFNFSVQDGLPIDNFSEKGKTDVPVTDVFIEKKAFMNQDNVLFFQTNEGLIYFHPDSIRIDTVLPPLLFHDFQLYNESVKVGDKNNVLKQSITFTKQLTLKAGQDVFTIQYGALEYFFPEEIKYAFILRGYDADWRYVGNTREATYTNLDPGTYTFEVKCQNRHGFWSAPITLKINILPPWYRTGLAYGLWLALLLGSGYKLYRFQLNRKLAIAETLRIKELDAVKTRLYTNITHEFRTPLTIIIGMAEQVMSNPKEWYHDGIRLIKRNGKQLLLLVNQMMDLSKLESGTMSIHWQQGNIIEYIRYLQESFHSLAANKHIDLQFYTNKETYYMDYDPEKMQNIVANLISNAIKYTPEGGSVILSLNTVTQSMMAQNALKVGDFTLTVSDTGMGIAPNKLPYIFDRFYQVDDSHTRKAEGTGIGLALTKELIHLLGGTIVANSTVGQGSEFIVTLPITNKAEIIDNERITPIESAYIIPEYTDFKGDQPVILTEKGKTKKERPLVLIVEDNPDVVRYLHICLQSEYRLASASNGVEGLAKTLDLIPDLVISDVMMPEMDGYELCQQLKTNILTSHIPIILLTAKGDMDSKIEGLTFGADEYLAKPFEERELKARLKNLLRLRTSLQERYRATAFAPPALQDKETLDELFIKEVKEFIDVHLSETHLDIHILEKQFGMSRTKLHRKLTALTGMHSTEFIRFVRLTKANELLRGPSDMSISEIAYDVGFTSLGYFTRCFKKLFGMSPSEWKESKSE